MKIRAVVPCHSQPFVHLPILLAGTSLSRLLFETRIERIDAPVQNLHDGPRTPTSRSVVLLRIETLLALAEFSVTEFSSLEAHTVQLEAFRILALARRVSDGYIFQQAVRSLLESVMVGVVSGSGRDNGK
jgi:hypothetical protein